VLVSVEFSIHNSINYHIGLLIGSSLILFDWPVKDWPGTDGRTSQNAT